jgi:hypothetical protein
MATGFGKCRAPAPRRYVLRPSALELLFADGRSAFLHFPAQVSAVNQV